MQIIIRTFIAALLLFTGMHSQGQLPFTVENMEHFSCIDQTDLIKAMKAYKDFKEDGEQRNEYSCQYSQSDSAGHGVFSHFILVHDKDKKSGKITVSMSSLFIARYIDTFALTLKSKGYQETTDTNDLSLGFRVFNKKPFDFYLPTAQKGHKGIMVMNNMPPVPPKKIEISGKIIQEMDIETIKEALSQGLDINAYLYTPSNYHPLEIAIEMDEVKYFDSPETIEKHLELIKFLINNGADVNKKDNWSKTPLFLASDRHIWLDTISTAVPFYDKVVELLLSKGANPNILDEHGGSALMNAVRFQHLEQVKLLLAHGADKTIVEKSSYGNFSALSFAKDELKHAKGKNKETAQAILNLIEK